MNLKSTMIGTSRERRLLHLSLRNCSGPNSGHYCSGKKNRDLFDLDAVLTRLKLDHGKIVACFEHYLSLQELSIIKSMDEQHMLEKLKKSLSEDVQPLLLTGIIYTDNDAIKAFNKVWFRLIQLIDGESWKGTEEVIEKLQASHLSNLLFVEQNGR